MYQSFSRSDKSSMLLLVQDILFIVSGFSSDTKTTQEEPNLKLYNHHIFLMKNEIFPENLFTIHRTVKTVVKDYLITA